MQVPSEGSGKSHDLKMVTLEQEVIVVSFPNFVHCCLIYPEGGAVH